MQRRIGPLSLVEGDAELEVDFGIVLPRLEEIREVRDAGARREPLEHLRRANPVPTVRADRAAAGSRYRQEHREQEDHERTNHDPGPPRTVRQRSVFRLDQVSEALRPIAILKTRSSTPLSPTDPICPISKERSICAGTSGKVEAGPERDEARLHGTAGGILEMPAVLVESEPQGNSREEASRPRPQRFSTPNDMSLSSPIDPASCSKPRGSGALRRQ